MAEVLELLVVWITWSALSFAAVGFDERRLSPERFARAWPEATRVLALVAFAPYAVAVHFGRTRRSLAGVALGLAVTALIWAVGLLEASAIEWLLPP